MIHKYSLCDACHSPYDNEKNVCLVCSYKKNKKVLISEDKAFRIHHFETALHDIVKTILTTQRKIYVTGIILSMLAIASVIVLTIYYYLNNEVLIFSNSLIVLSKISSMSLLIVFTKTIPHIFSLIQNSISFVFFGTFPYLWKMLNVIIQNLLNVYSAFFSFVAESKQFDALFYGKKT